MEAIVERCCGLDVHQATVVACMLVGAADKRPKKEVRTFGTKTRELMALRDWLVEQQCTHVGMEATGVYWMPIYAILEEQGRFELVVGNAHHIKNVPGRKTDVKDSEWIADLLRHGLIAKSFVPPKPIRELRDLVRYRRKLVESRIAERNRLQRLLETANIKLASVASDVFGVSGMKMLRALVKGVATPSEMAQLAKARLRKKLADLTLALDGRIEEHHRFILETQLSRLDQIDDHIKALDERIENKVQPFKQARDLLTTLPGVDRVLAASLLAEIGPDMGVFKSASHLAAWAGVCPGNNESAGKRKQSATRRGNVHLMTALSGGSTRRNQEEGQLLQGQVLPPQGTPWSGTCRHGDRAQDPHSRLSHALNRHTVRRPGSGIPRQHRHPPHQGQPGQATRTAGIRGHDLVAPTHPIRGSQGRYAPILIAVLRRGASRSARLAARNAVTKPRSGD